MSGILEQLLAAVTRNNELLEAAAEGRQEVMKAVEAASTKATTTRTKAADKPATEKAADKPAAEKTDAAAVSVDAVKDAIKKYVGGTDREEERKARAAKVKGVLTKFSPEGTDKPTAETLAEDKRGPFIKTVDKWIADGDLTEAPAADTGGDEDDDLLDD